MTWTGVRSGFTDSMAAAAAARAAVGAAKDVPDARINWPPGARSRTWTCRQRLNFDAEEPASGTGPD